MDFLSSSGFLTFVLVIGGLIFVHELGHFIAARRTGVRVDEFGFGFPPRVLGIVQDSEGRWRVFFGNRRPGRGSEDREAVKASLGTIYSLNLIPLGGFVRPAGEDNPSVPGGLAASSKRVRLVVLAAGAAMNLLVAYLAFVAGFKVGWPDRVAIANVVPESPASAAGLMPGDVILTASGNEIHYFAQLIRQTQEHLGLPLALEVQRGEETVKVTLVPRTEWPEDQGPMGIEMQMVFIKDYSWSQALVRAAQEIGLHIREIATLPSRIFKGEVPLAIARPIGLKGIYDLTDQAVESVQVTDEWYPLIQLVGLISVALAFTNLLPLPALDGGRILFVLLEAVRGRRVAPEREGFVHAVGFVVLLALMLIINVQDFVNPVVPPR